MPRKGGVPENLIPAKKGEIRNPHGGNRKTISLVNIELEKQGYNEATKQDIVSCYLRLIQLPIPELKKMVDSGVNIPSLVRIVAKSILSGKGFDVIEKILDRGIGKAINITELTGKDGKDLNAPMFIFQDISGKVIEK
jgi:hypothetical protein